MNRDTDVQRLEADGYGIAMYRDPNSGDMRFEITAPQDELENIEIDVNDERLELPRWLRWSVHAPEQPAPVLDDDRPCPCGRPHTAAEHNYNPEREAEQAHAEDVANGLTQD